MTVNGAEVRFETSFITITPDGSRLASQPVERLTRAYRCCLTPPPPPPLQLNHGDWFGGKAVGMAVLNIGNTTAHFYVTHVSLPLRAVPSAHDHHAPVSMGIRGVCPVCRGGVVRTVSRCLTTTHTYTVTWRAGVAMVTAILLQ